ncbi:MAG: 16S rRNA (cytosine(1402)-N(4))-methyltransferase RsmH [Candidatus Vogelbacteria bacterium]|nr:16S rRNA (cytosine(1402)-N(4))-methyltransferase RsmH [Candidatus Vogelbacteria bacterium]
MHIPVLLQSTIGGLDIKVGETAVDATLGLGGHAKEICTRLGKTGLLVGIDQDSGALAKAKKNLADCPAWKILKLGNFRDITKILAEEKIDQVDIVLFDFGFNSEQMDESGRGFSFQKDEPLLMTLSDQITPETLTAEEIVNTWEEKSLTDIIYGYGEERQSRQIAKAIVEARSEKKIKTTFDLVEIIRSVTPLKDQKRKTHFATKTFQALRITVNDELGAIKDGLAGAWEKLADGGRIGVISFHSLEARLVKEFIKTKESEGVGKRLNKKVIKPSLEEIKENPRSRSAQLRIFKKSLPC